MTDVITVMGVGIGLGTVLIILCLAVVFGIAIALAVVIDVWHRRQLEQLDRELRKLQSADRVPKWVARESNSKRS